MKTSGTVEPGQTLIGHGTLAPFDTLSVDAGTPSSTLGGAIDVPLQVVNSGSVTFFGSVRPGIGAATGTIDKSGVVLTQIDGGSITVDGAAYYPDQDRFGSGASLKVAGVLDNGGGVIVNGGGKGGLLNIVAGGTLNDTASMVIRGGEAPFASVGGTVNVAGVLNNGAGNPEALLRLYGGGASRDSSVTNSGAQLDITGVLTNTGVNTQINIFGGENEDGYGMAAGATLTIGSTGYFDNRALVSISPGNFSSYGYGVRPGIGGGVLSVAGTLHNESQIQAFGGQGFNDNSPAGATIAVTGLLTNNYGIFLGSGYFDSFLPGGPGLGSLLLVQGTLVNDQKTYQNPGYGIKANGGNGGPDPNHIGHGATIDVAGTLDNITHLTLYPGFNKTAGPGYQGGTGAVLVDSGTLVNSGTITVLVGKTGGSAELTVTATGTLTGSGTINGGGIVDNLGLILASGTAAIVGGNLLNDGTVAVAADARLTIGAAIVADPAHHGALNIAAGGVLTLVGGVGRDQSVAFAGPGATLAFGNAAGFAGVLTNFIAGDTLDLLGVNASGAWSIGTTLAVDINGGRVDLGLASPLSSNATLSLGSDGFGGTELSLTNATDASTHTAASAPPAAAAHDGDDAARRVSTQPVRFGLLVHHLA